MSMTEMTKKEENLMQLHLAAEESWVKFSYAKPDGVSSGKGMVALGRKDIVRGVVQVVKKDGGENNLHYHSGIASFWFVLKGRVRFYGPDDVVIGEFGPMEGTITPRFSRYWFENCGEGDLEILQVAAFCVRETGEERPHRRVGAALQDRHRTVLRAKYHRARQGVTRGRRFEMRLRAGLIGVIALAMTPGVVLAQEVPFYKGKQIRIVISTGVAGGYAEYARTLAEFMGRHIAGHPSFLVQSMPGAGGLTATNYLYSNAPQDGTTIGIVHSTVPLAPLWGSKGARFETLKMHWLGAFDRAEGVCLTWHTSPVKTWTDLLTKPSTVGSSGVGSQMDAYPAMLNSLFGTKMKVIGGYKSGTDIFLAMERGELDGRCGGQLVAIKATRPEWLTEKKIHAPITIAEKRSAAFPDTPAIMEFVKDDETRRADGPDPDRADHGPADAGAARSAGRARQGIARCFHRDHARPGIPRGNRAAQSPARPDERRGHDRCAQPRLRRAAGDDRRRAQDHGRTLRVCRDTVTPCSCAKRCATIRQQ